MANPLELPDILAELCSAFHDWEGLGWLKAHIGQAEAVLTSGPIASEMDESGLRGAWEALVPRLAEVEARTGLPYELFFEALKLLQALDRWHEPFSAPFQDMTRAHNRLRNRFTLSKDVSSYNVNVQSGLVIPPWPRAETRPPSDMSILAGLLHHTAYLPAKVPAGEANEPRKVDRRRLNLRYRQSPSGLPVAPDDDDPVIALAPVLQYPEDATIAINLQDRVYAVDLHYNWRRMSDILDAALESGARLLLLPEMTVRSADAPRLMKLFKDKLLESVEKGREPSLLYIIAGLVAGREAGAKAGRNEVVLFHAGQDETAEPFFRQAKLCRWNLNEETQVDFLHQSHGPELCEDIEEGREIFVADLDGLGRTLALICADMEADEPGHWLIKNIGVDWLYAPIMDRSITHRIQAGSAVPQLKPWVVDRAAIAVRQGATRAVVVNSLALTYANNATPVSRPYLPFKKCGWAFMLDRSDVSPQYREVETNLPADGKRPLVCTLRWLDDFKPAPKIMW